MPISYNEQLRVFRLDTPRTTYLMGLAGSENFLGHIYYGPPVPDDDLRFLLRLEEKPFTPDECPQDRASFYDCFPFEYPAWGGGNFREPCLRVRTAQGGGNCELFYESHRIFRGKPGLEGLPAAYGDDGETLEIVLRDPVLELRVHLLYTVFDGLDAVCRSARIENCGAEAVELAFLSAQENTVIVDFGSLSYLGDLIKIVEKGYGPGRNLHGK